MDLPVADIDSSLPHNPDGDTSHPDFGESTDLLANYSQPPEPSDLSPPPPAPSSDTQINTSDQDTSGRPISFQNILALLDPNDAVEMIIHSFGGESEGIDDRLSSFIQILREKIFMKGVEQYRANQFEEAISCFEQCLVLDDQDVDAYYNKGVSLSDLNRYEEAISCHDRCLRIDDRYAAAHYDRYADAYNNKGNALRNLKRYDEAISCYDQCLSIDDQYFAAYNGKGNAFSALKRFDEAISCYDQCLSIDDQYVAAYNGKGNAFSALKRFDEAISCYDQCLSIDDQCAAAYNNKGISLKNLKRFKEAISCYDQCLRINDQDAAAYLNKGISLCNLIQFEEAITCFDQCLSIDDRYVAAYSNKGNALSDLKRFEEAISCYDQCLSVDGRNADVYNGKGNVFMNLRQYEEAISCFDQCFSIDDRDVDAHNTKGVALFNLKRFDEAISCFDRCLSLDDRSVLAYHNKGNAFIHLKRFEEAISCYDQCLSVDDQYVAAYNGKGVALSALKRFLEAISCYDQCLRINDQYFAAYSNKGRAFSNLKRFEEAISCFDQCLGIDDQYVAAYNGKGIAFMKLNRFDAAISAFNQCLSIDHGFLYANNNKGLVFRALGRSEEALLCYDKCVELDCNFVMTCNSNATSLSEVELILGQDDFAGLVTWFVRSLEISGQVVLFSLPSLVLHRPISEETAIQYSFSLFNEGIFTVKILNSCRRSKLLTSDQLVGMGFPRPIQRFLMSPPEEAMIDHSDIGDLRVWLRVVLGVSCDIFLDKLHSALRNKHYLNLKVLRVDSDLSCGDLVDAGALNIYAAQAIIESLNFERLAKSNPSGTACSLFSCQGLPIAIDQTIREGRILRGNVSVLGDTVAVIVKLHHSDEDFHREFSMMHRLKAFASSGSLSHAPDLLDFGQSLAAQPKPYLVMKSFGLPLSHFFSIHSTNAYRLEIGTQLLGALMWLHQQDIVHCDLKPDNVLVEDGGGGIVKVKLCDFDSATDVDGEFPYGSGPSGERVLKFTREWVSPEVYLSNRSLHLEPGAGAVLSAQKPMDVFPLGLMLACLFSRERSARMTMLSEDEVCFHATLTEAGSLFERISCDCFSVTDSCRESVRSLCVLDPVSRGSLSGALSGLEKLRSTQLQIENASLGRVNDAQSLVIKELREGVERIEARVYDATPLQ